MDMKQSSLEITGNEYLIRLNKEDFDLSFINHLLKRIQAEQHFFSRSLFATPDEDILSRREDDWERFDRLQDK
jgi:hypothetical protein